MEVKMDYKQLEELRQTSQKAFLREASRHYGIEEQCLLALLDDYDIEPRQSQGHSGQDPVPLLMRDIAERVKLPIKVVGRLQDMGVINSPISCDDFEFLKSYEKTWTNSFLLRRQLARFSQKQREEFIKRPEFSNKWERWIYSRYFFNEIEYGHGNRMINPENRIRIYDLAEQVESMFHVPNCQNTRDRIKKIRETAFNDKKKVSETKSTERAVLRARNLPETELDFFADTFVFDLYS
jgi:hypothetical protein